jgi:hypothetical protein
VAIGFATAFCFAAAGVSARGVYLETAPWQGVAIADTVLGFSAGMVVATGDTSAVLFPVAFSPIRRGPLRVGLTWSAQSVRTAEQRVFGFGDPKLFVRLRVAGTPGGPLRFYTEGAVRIPTATAKLFPYANGGQELELAASFEAGSDGWLRGGGGRIWTEPGAGGGVAQSDVPHAIHGWAGFAPRLGRIATLLRADGLWFDNGETRGLFQGIIAYTGTNGLRFEARGGAEAGGRDVRVLDALFGVRFVMALR